MSKFLVLFRIQFLKEYFTSFITVLSGAAFSGFIPIIIAPFLTRLYSPEDFGRYGFLVSLSIILGFLSTMRYEHSIIIAKNDRQAFHYLILCEYLSLFFHLIFITIAILFCIIYYSNFTSNKWIHWCVLLTLTSLSAIFLRIQVLWLNRRKAFKIVSSVRITQTIICMLLSVSLGLLSWSYGLIWSIIFSNLIGIILLKRKQDNNFLKRKRLKENVNYFILLIKRYKNFPIFSLPAELLNTVTSNYPLLVFPFLFGNEITGYITLAYKVVGMPAKFISVSLSEVFFQRASQDMRNHGQCKSLFLLNATALTFVSLIGFSVLFMTCDYLFPLFAGSQWNNSTIYLKFLIPLFSINFVVSPLSTMIYTGEKQNWDLYWQILFFILISLSSLEGWLSSNANPQRVVLLISSAGSFAYIVYFIILFKLSIGSSVNKKLQKIL